MRVTLILLCVACLPVLLPAQFEDAFMTSGLVGPRKQKEKPGQKIAEAEAALARATSQGEQSPETAEAASALADLYLKAGDYERAKRLIERALGIRRTSFGEKHQETAASYQQLAEFREELGAFEEAKELYSDALSAREHVDPNSLETAATLHAMGRLLSKMNNLLEAEKSLRSALAIRKEKSPMNDLETAYTLYELAKIEASNGNDSEARTLAEQAHKIFETELGSDDPNAEDARNMMEPLGDSIGQSAFGLAVQIGEIGSVSNESRKAEPVRRKIFLSGPYNEREAERLSDYAQRLLEAGNANDREQAFHMQERSLRIRQRVLGPDHPKTLESLQRLGFAALDRSQYDRALLCARKAMFAQTQLLQRIFSFTDEQQRLAYQSTVSPYSVFASLPEVPAGDLATAVLRFKGAVLDSLLAEPGLGAGGLAASATISQIASVLAPDALLIEMIRYPHHFDGTRIEERYGALVIASTGEPKWISLGGANVIDENIELYRKSVRYESTLRNLQAYYGSERDNTSESALHLVLRSLHDQVWAPIEKALPAGSKTIILSPDGALNFISFATLLNAKDEFLIQKYSIRYVASGRDLLRNGEVSPTELLAVFGNPDFDSQPKLMARSGANRALAMRSSELRDFKSISLIRRARH